MLKRLVIFGLLLAAFAATAQKLLDLSMGQTAEAVPATGDEGWRRTSQGWERLSPRIIRPANAAEVAAQPIEVVPAATWPLHPVGLVVFLILGTATACYLFPRENPALAGRQSQTLF